MTNNNCFEVCWVVTDIPYVTGVRSTAERQKEIWRTILSDRTISAASVHLKAREDIAVG